MRKKIGGCFLFIPVDFHCSIFWNIFWFASDACGFKEVMAFIRHYVQSIGYDGHICDVEELCLLNIHAYLGMAKCFLTLGCDGKILGPWNTNAALGEKTQN